MKLADLPYFERWLVMGSILGIISGISSLTFYFSIRLFESLFLHEVVGYTPPLPIGEGGTFPFTYGPPLRPLLFPLVTALGGFLAGLLVYLFAPEAEGHGTDAAISAFHYKAGKIRWRVIPVKLLSSAITIGSGNSAGREGPTAQMSAGIGSMVADLLGLSPEERREAVAVGIGAGIGTIFKTPIGGALLAAELLYKRDLETEVIFPGLVASAIGYSIFGGIVGYTPLFGFYTGSFNPLKLPLYAILGVLVGILSMIYPKIFYFFTDRFRSSGIPLYIRSTIGGAATGLLLIFFPELASTGYGWVNSLVVGDLSGIQQATRVTVPLILLLFLLPALKVLATSLSIGSGQSGGVFAPGIFIGASAGAALGYSFHLLLPSLVGSITPFVVVGMVSLLGGATKTPLASLVMVTEMTGSLQLLPAAMVAVAISYIVSGDNTIYRSQVLTRKESPAHAGEYERPLLSLLKLSDVPKRDIRVRLGTPIPQAVEVMRTNGLFGMPVVDDDDKFLGVVYIDDLDRAVSSGDNTIDRWVRRGVPSVYVSSTAMEAWEVMSKNLTRWAPVVAKDKLVGIVTMEDILQAYRRVMRRDEYGEESQA